MTDTEKAKDWYRLVELKINAAMGINDPKAILLIKKILDNDNVKRWSGWHPNALELQRLQTIKKSIDLLRNPNSGKNWLEAKEKLAAAWAGSDVPWPLIRQGLSPFMDVEKNTILTQPAISPQSGVGTNAAKKSSYEPTKSAASKAIGIKLPSDPQHIWLAIGDETGDWDYEAKKQSKRGLVLVIGRLDVWQRAFDELIDGQTVAERMRQPLQHLPSGCKKSHFHHGIDAFKLDVNSLSPALIKELQENLGWLAQHSELITLGFNATHSELYQNFTFGQDASQTLAKSYAILLAYMMPFLEKEDVLLLGFETRSENADTIAAVRSNFNGASNKDGRLQMDMRVFSTTFRDALLHHLNKGWPQTKNWEQRFDLAPLNQLLKAPDLKRLCPRLSNLPNSAWKGLADLGASILQAQLNDKLNKHLTFTETPNVHFSKLPELLS